MSGILNIGEVNELGAEQFVWMFGNVVESYKDAAIQISGKGPFTDAKHLCQSFNNFLENLPEEEKLKILCLHPDLAGKLANSNKLTEESAREQKSANLDQLSDEQKKTINLLNYNYKEKFGFPFVVCARENKVKVIIEQLEKRCKNTKEQEINTGINEVKKICNLRILDIVW